MPEENTKRLPKGGVRFDLMRYLFDQMKQSLTELNIHATCVEHRWTREEALANHDALLQHYNTHGGADNFKKFRARYTNYCEFLDNCRFGETCELASIQSDFIKCPLRQMNEHCRGTCEGACIKCEAVA